MKLRAKLFTTVAMFALTVALVVCGVWALHQANFTMGGTITFYASDVNVLITGSVSGAETIPTLSNLKYSASEQPSPEQLQTWKNDLAFKSDATPVKITMTIQNLSEERSLTVSVVDNFTSSTNINKSITKGEDPYTSGTGVTVLENGSVTFTLTISVASSELSASAEYGWLVKLVDENAPADQDTVAGINFEYDDTTMTAKVTGSTLENVVVPAFVSNNGNTYRVTSIGRSAFENNTTLKSITLPDTIEVVDTYAFSGCTNLAYTTYDNGKYLGNASNPYLVLAEATSKTITSLNVHEDCKMIGNLACYECESLATVTFCEGLERIGYRAFAFASSLDGVSIPSSVKFLGDGTFGFCTSLTSIAIPDGITAVPEMFVYGCTSLTSVTIPDSVKRLEMSCFRQCSALSEVVLPANLEYIGYSSFYGTALEKLVVPESLQSFDQYAFYGCTALKEINIPSSVTTLPDYLFDRCSALEEFVIPDNIKTLGLGVFYRCTSLKEMKIPESVTEIGDYMFYNCYSLESVTLPSTITEIPHYMFNDCVSLVNVNLPDTITFIGASAFADCQKLNVKIPANVKEIHYGAFYENRSMTDISLPSTVEFIGDHAFNHCKGALNTKIVIPAGIKQIGGGTYDVYESPEQLYDPENPNPDVFGTHVFYDAGTNALQEFEISEENENYMTVDGVLYRKENGVPTVLIAYPADKRDATYDMPDTVVTAFELSLSRPYYLRKIILSDSFVIQNISGANIGNEDWANNLSGMIYRYCGVIEIECNPSNPNYASENGCVYDKNYTTLYYAPFFSGLKKGDATEKTLSIKAGVTTIAFGSLGCSTKVSDNVPTDGTNLNEENHLKRYDKVFIPASVTTISDETITMINNVGWTIEVEETNTVFEDSNGKLIRKTTTA